MTTFSNTMNVTATITDLAAAFSAQAKITDEENLIGGTTLNGDINYSSLGPTPEDALLALDQETVLSEDSRKTRVLAFDVKHILDTHFESFLGRTQSMNDVDRANAFNLMFRYLFYLRSARVPGKKSKLLFYYLFKKLYAIYPKTCIALLELVPEFGYFCDLDNIMQEMSAYPDVINAAIAVYIKHLNADCVLIFGKPLAEITNDEAKTLNDKLKTMSVEDVRAFVGSKRLSLASKWVGREGKSKSSHRVDMLIAIYYPNGGIRELQIAHDSKTRAIAKSRINYCQMRFRKVVTTLSQCLLVGEQMMCEEDHSHRTWADIQHKNAPATFMTKYRKALANEHLKVPVPTYQEYTGNRHPNNDDRVECRQNLLTELINSKVKGSAQDIDRLGTIIYNHVAGRQISSRLSSTERKVISAQWNDLVSKLKIEIDVAVEAAKALAAESGETFLDPRNVVPIVDTSGSMAGAKVQDKAIALGVLASQLSTMPGALIAFSERPSVYSLDLSPGKDVFDWFLTIVNGPTGYSTNIDATYDCMLDLMTKANMKATTFAMLYLTDGQFDSGVVVTSSKLEGTALGRMQTKYTNAGYNMPRTVFWNLNARSPGFPASATSKGVQLVSGYSQALMIQVFTGDYKYVVQADGSVKVDVDPWTSFEKALLIEGYDPVTRVVASVGEGCLAKLRST